MGHYAVLVPAYTGHLNPILALARALVRRGHRITLVAPRDAGPKALAAGVDFIAIGEREFPAGGWALAVARSGELTGLAATRAASTVLGLFARAVQRELPAIVARERFDGVVMDQIAVGTEGVCEVLGLPLAVACCALPFQIESSVPPSLFPWPYRPTLWTRGRNTVAQFCVNWCGLPVAREVVPYRFRHRLRPMGYHYINELRPSLVQVAQLPAFCDFPRRHLPTNFHYTAPWIDDGVGGERNFPWQQLDGRPLVYASLGTVQNRLASSYQLIADACTGLDAQLVLALGREGATPPDRLPPGAIAVDYAPQLALVRRASVVVTHGGLNTTLECLRAGVPMVALTITNDQPGVAARIHHLGAGEFLPIRGATAAELRERVLRVLNISAYRCRAHECANQMRALDGPAIAAELIETAFTTRQRVLRNVAADLVSAS